MKPSSRCIDFIKTFEGYSEKAYLCPAGIATIGYGTTENVRMGDTVTKEQACSLLLEDVIDASAAIDSMVHADLAQHQYDALCSFVYNVGPEAFRKSTLLLLINGAKHSAAEVGAQFDRWTRGGGKILSGLVRRRAGERAMYEGKP